MAFRSWFPRALQEQAAFIANFTRVFVEIAASLGFSAEVVARLEADNAVMQYLAQMDYNLKTYIKGFNSFRNNLTGGKQRVTPKYPKINDISEPPIVPYGIFERLFKLADLIEASDGYSTIIGARLGILPQKQEALRREDLVLNLKIREFPEGEIEIRFVKGRTSGVSLDYRYDGTQERHDLGRFFKSPVKLKLPMEDGKPVKIYVRGRYLLGNEEIGAYSNEFEVILIP